jgi:hypothetical protein
MALLNDDLLLELAEDVLSIVEQSGGSATESDLIRGLFRHAYSVAPASKRRWKIPVSYRREALWGLADSGLVRLEHGRRRGGGTETRFYDPATPSKQICAGTGCGVPRCDEEFAGHSQSCDVVKEWVDA